ncbi:MAG: carboxypeptidase-like regulatory domain-containing protein [Mucilaginibacter sp.]|nr:carboxypeptidase-like regulatory domain-containing protein [Mucilaginibacter sp.]
MFKFLLFLFLLPASLFAQNVVTGKLMGFNDKMPIANVSVFLNNSSIGNETQQDGSFKLTNVKNGQYDMVVSCVGYVTYHQQIFVYNNNLNLPDIELEISISSLNEVKIVSKQKKIKTDPNRKRYIRMFTEAFFGNTKNARDCKLLNPELLDFNFEQNNDKLSATSHGFLILENKALGYRIKYLLTSFLIDPGDHIIYYTGSSVFFDIDSTAAQQKIWRQKRVKAYLGSEMHFLRACIANQLTDDGFTVRKLVRTPIVDRPSDSVIYANIKESSKSSALHYWKKLAGTIRYNQKLFDRHLYSYEFISKTDTKGIYALAYPYCLMINYGNERSTLPDDNTIITFTEPYAYFDSNGVIANPQSNKVEDYWSTQRIAELLPVDYELPKE